MTPFLHRVRIRMRLVVLALLGGFLPGLALAQSGAMTPIHRCEQTYGSCVRACSGPDSPMCMAGCATVRAHCIQNPSTATQPRR
jgi:hypothetical protein